jgi:hypothetical protein
MNDPYLPDWGIQSADEMKQKEVEALRLAVLILQRYGGRIVIPQEEITRTSEEQPVLTAYYDPFEHGGTGAYVYELVTQETFQKEFAKKEEGEDAQDLHAQRHDSQHTPD